MMLAKPSRLTHDVAQWARRVARANERTRAVKAAQAAWAKLSAAVRERDHGRCRVCAVETIRPGSGDPRLFGQAHHIRYRSAGGPDEMWNLVWICTACSEGEHTTHTISITGTADNLLVTPRRRA